mgnify:CR=1 FL=1
MHRYGAHIFHTSDKEVWDFVNEFAEFNNYINSPIANYKGELYNLPFNMNTFSKLWGVVTPDEARAKIAEQVANLGIDEPKNLVPPMWSRFSSTRTLLPFFKAKCVNTAPNSPLPTTR